VLRTSTDCEIALRRHVAKNEKEKGERIRVDSTSEWLTNIYFEIRIDHYTFARFLDTAYACYKYKKT
jgi:hypothetical protein